MRHSTWQITALAPLIVCLAASRGASAIVSEPRQELTPLATTDSAFDGTWQVESVRLEGRCVERNTSTIIIRGGVMEGVIEGRAGTYYLKGRVSEDGGFESRLEGKNDSVTIRGLLTGDKGEGRWASRSKCTGTWTLQRIQ